MTTDIETADITAEQYNLIRQFDGDTEGLVAAASEVSSPLHDLFDWSSTDLAGSDNRRVSADALIAKALAQPDAPVADTSHEGADPVPDPDGVVSEEGEPATTEGDDAGSAAVEGESGAEASGQ
jgi:hypothetical protein